MADTGQEFELLFFDTFSHESAEELNLDLVQFPRPVIIQEIRVIPLQTKVEADVPGGVRLGATNPSTFKLELFVNNLSKPNAATFESLGVMDYKENVNIQLKTDSEVPTDGLILKGWYNTITVAIYGVLTIVKQDHHASPPPPPPPQPRAKPQTVEPRSSGTGEIPLQEWETTRPGAKPPPAQHPLDYIQEQVNLQKQAQALGHMAHPSSQAGPPPQGQHVSSSNQPGSTGDGYRGSEHRDILQELIQSPKVKHSDGVPSQREFSQDSREQFDRSRDYEYRKKESGRDYERSRESSHDRDNRESSREREKERRKKEAWERFRKRESEKSRDYSERDWNRSPVRRSYSRSHSRSRSRSFSRSPARSRTPRRSKSRSPPPQRRARSPHRSLSRSPRRSPPRRQRSLTPHRTPSRSPEPLNPRSPSPSPQRSRSESFEEPPPPSQHVQVPTIIHPMAREPPVPMPPMVFNRPPPPIHDYNMMGHNEEALDTGDSMIDDGGQEYLEPLTPDQNSMFMSEASDGELQDDNYENISSDEDMMESSELAGIDMYEITDELTDDSWTYDIGTFNPYRAEVTPLTTFPDIAQTSFEQEKQNMLVKFKEKPEEVSSILNLVEQFTDTDHQAKWIEAMEGLPALLPKGLFYLLYKDNKKDILDILTDWTLEGLTLEKAINQPDAAYKVRHLKMGIRVAASLCSCDEAVAINVLSKDVQHKLLDIFSDQYTSFSIKLLIIQALDQTTRLSVGMEWLLGKHSLQEDKAQETCYQRILNIMQTKQVVRVVVALTALVKKVHYYEVMNKLSEHTNRMIEVVGTKENVEIKEDDVESIIHSLSDVIKVFSIAPHLISQPKRGLPGKMMFEVAQPISDPYPNLYHFANKTGLLQSLLVLISSPVTGIYPKIVSLVKNFVQKLIHSHHGLLYLSSQTETTSTLIKLMLNEYPRDESEENPLQMLGLEMVHHLQTLQYIDQLNEFHNKEETEIDDSGALATLHNLYTMSVTAVGRDALVRVLSADNNVKSLLPFIELTGNDERDAKLKKSVCASYSLQLLLLVIRNSDDVRVLERFSSRLLAICETDYSSKVLELQEWLAPIKHITSYNYDGVSSAVQQIKLAAEDIQKIQRPLITTCRILRHMTIQEEKEYPDDVPEEIKYKYALLDVYGEDCFPVLMHILQKVNEILIRPWQQGSPMSAEQMTYYLSAVKPCLEIVKSTLCFLIGSRGGEFKDLTSLPVLFELHTIMCSVPLSSYFIDDIQKIQKNVIDTLVAYTQPVVDVKDSGEALTGSLWTKTMKELIKYTTRAPYTYLSGLLMVSELLPLPLPLQTKEKLSDEEVDLAVNSRKLWSAHLHSLTPQIQEMINILATSTCQPLQQVLRRVCWQLADLSAPSATMVTRCVLDMVVNSLDTLGIKVVESGEGSEGQEERVERIASPFASKMLNLLAFVLAHPPIKCATLQLMLNAGNGSDEKYGQLLTQFLEILNSVCDRVPHVQAQECIVSIIQSLCDIEVSMITGDPSNEQIAYSLPQSSDMVMITTALLDHMGSADHSYASIFPCVRTLVMLTEHDYGFYYLKKVLEQKTTALGRLMVRINTTFSKDSSDCLSTLSTLLDFLRLLVCVETPLAGINVTRTYTLSHKELHQVLSWNPSMENHPLLDLEKMLEDCAKDDDIMKGLLDSMKSLMKMLRDPETDQEKKPMPEPTKVEPESLSNLFLMRSVYEICAVEDERLSEAYWLSNPITDEVDVEPDLIRMDMEEICSKYCPNYNLEEELKKTTVSSNEEVTKPRRLRHGDRRKSQEINLYRGKGFKRPFVAPMRGRGITRGLLNNSGRSDNFRCRPPNTSRPPSMHVDDFMKLEKGGSNAEHNAGPPQHEDFSRRMEHQDMNRGGFRGRGFDRGRGTYRGRGGFFTPPANYRSRESSNNIYITQGDSGRDNRPKSNFAGRSSFSRGNRQGFEDRRGRDFRFSPRGRGGGGGNYWQGKESEGDRFGNPSQFYGRRDEHNPPRHARSFTK